MAYDADEESRTVKMPWMVAIQDVHETIPPGEEIRVLRDHKSGNVRVMWKGFPTKHLGFSALVTEEDLAAHT